MNTLPLPPARATGNGHRPVHRARGFSAILAALALSLAFGAVAPRSALTDACGAHQPPAYDWRSTGGVDHPLVGRVYASAGGRFLVEDAAELTATAAQFASKRFLLLGEVHDNPDHHALRARLIDALGCMAEAPKAVVFEHIRRDQQAVLDRYAAFDAGARRRGTSGDLLRMLEWDKSGWPSSTLFRPLFDAVLAAGLAIYPGDAPRTEIRAIARGEDGGVPTATRARLEIDQPMPAALIEALAAELKDSHCGALPASAIAGMSNAQRYRDAHLADAMRTAADRHGGAILLAGNGHVRSDRGVPWYIRQTSTTGSASESLVSLMFVEVEDRRDDPASYAPRGPDGSPAVDYIVFTPRAERTDPCAEMVKASPAR